MTGASASKARFLFRPVDFNPWADGVPTIETPSIVTLPNGSIMAFGGYDLFVYDAGVWHTIEPLGSVRPSERSGHAMTAVGKDIYLFGGYAAAGEEEGHLKVAVRRSRRSLAPIT